MERFYLKRYVQVLNGKIVDTTLLLPHIECYFIRDDKLYVESTEGYEYYLGIVVKESNDLEDLVGEIEFKLEGK